MKTLKFRAWIHTLDYYDVMENKFPIYEMIYSDEPEFNDWFGSIDDLQESKYSLMQFTGLVDANGHDIYEGDIVRYWNNHKVIVKWVEAGFNIAYMISECIFFPDESEVVGNIYENPELV